MTVYARIGNLSEGGLFLRTSTPLERGSHTKLRFGGTIEAEAEVVWARSGDGAEGPPGMGLMFVGIDSNRQQMIRKLIEGEQSAAKNGSNGS